VKRILVTLTIAAIFIVPVISHAKCTNSGQLNPESDVCWDCMFPLSIAGIEVMEGPYENDVPSMASVPICICPANYPQEETEGIPLSYWEPARYIETVRDPYCMPSMGGGMGSGSGLSSLLNGNEIYGTGATNSSPADYQANLSTMQAHFFLFPIFQLMDILQDMITCTENGSYDVEFMSETDPLWQDDTLSFIADPEGLLFADYTAQISCMLDGASTAVGYSLDLLYWCIASSGSLYPITGHLSENDAVQAHMGAAARSQFWILRSFADCDPGLWYCGCVPTPIWVKHNYRIQLATPINDNFCNPYGRTSLIWGSEKDPPYISQRNFVWIIFRRHICCDAENKAGG
jgi:conjugal transfer pilus assembly protein TraU